MPEILSNPSVHLFDLILIVLYLVGMILFGRYYGKNVKSSRDYFLAARSLPWWIIAMSIVGSNIGATDYVGAAGSAYRIGVAQANFEWIGAIPAMVLSAFIFIPFFWRAGVYSIPEFLGNRYSVRVRILSAGILAVFSVFIVGVFLWASAIMLKTYLGWPIWVSVLVTAAVVGFYTISGGLAAVAISDSVQFAIMVVGGIALAWLGIDRVGGVDEFVHRLQTEYPGHLQAFLPSSHEEFPWDGVILGLGFVLSPAYWCANQVVLQRTMAARSAWDGQASMIFAGIAKTFIPVLIVLPGLLALLLTNGSIQNPDETMPWMIREILPPGLSGLLFVAFIAALQSSVDSTLNSTATVVTRDIIGVLRPMTDDKKILRLGKRITFATLFLGVCSAPLTAYFDGIYVYVQQVLSFFQGPMFAIVLLGVTTKRIAPSSGLPSVLLGIASAATMSIAGVTLLYTAFFSFVVTVVLLLLFTALARPSEHRGTDGLAQPSGAHNG
jgi:solute:Na+ symporter, SSS family